MREIIIRIQYAKVNEKIVMRIICANFTSKIENKHIGFISTAQGYES